MPIRSRRSSEFRLRPQSEAKAKHRPTAAPSPAAVRGSSFVSVVVGGLHLAEMDTSDLILQFCNITSADPVQAESYLKVRQHASFATAFADSERNRYQTTMWNKQ